MTDKQLTNYKEKCKKMEKEMMEITGKTMFNNREDGGARRSDRPENIEELRANIATMEE